MLVIFVLIVPIKFALNVKKLIKIVKNVNFMKILMNVFNVINYHLIN